MSKTSKEVATVKTNKRFLTVLLFLMFVIAFVALCSCDADKGTLSVQYDNSKAIYEGVTLLDLREQLTVTYTDADGNPKQVTDYKLSGNVALGYNTITAIYGKKTASFTVFVNAAEAQRYVVKFVINDVIVSVQTYTVGEKNINKPYIPPREGYDAAWPNIVLSKGDITVEPVYTPKTYTLTFDYNGATGGNEQSSWTVKTNQFVGNLPIPTKENHIFAGWYTDEDRNEQWSDGSYDRYICDMTLYADWLDVTVPSKELEFTLNEDGLSYSVSKITAVPKDVVIPALYNGKPVTAIKDNAVYQQSIQRIVIPASVTSIDAPFRFCHHLSSVYYMGTLADWCKIDFADYGANPLCYLARLYINNAEIFGNLIIPEGVAEIKDFAFYGYSIPGGRLTIPSTVTSIGYKAFVDMAVSSITVDPNNTAYYSEGNCLIEKASKTLILGSGNSTVIPQGVTEIADSAFDLTFINSITIPDTVTKIGADAFKGCAFDSVVIPDSVTEIGDGAFISKRLKNVTFGSGLKTIGSLAFLGCNLTDIIIPASVTEIAFDAFKECGAESITVDKDNPVYYSANNCIIETATKTLIIGCKNSVIPDGVTSIGESAFAYVELTDFVIPSSVTTIGKYAFCNCRQLTTVEILDGVTTIEYGAFYGAGIKCVIIPDSVTNIGNSAFGSCRSLEEVVFKGTMQQWYKITKGEYWNIQAPYSKVICTDGELRH